MIYLQKNPCRQCHTQPAKYTCPRCGIRTCSLTCVKSHKIDFDCDGIRDKTAYVPLDNFTVIHLLSDYRLLEDVTRVAERSKRDILARQHRKPPFLQYLTKEAYKRNIRFKTMPYPMHRRKTNNSMYHKTTDTILWDVTWVFPCASVQHTEKRMSEKLLIAEAFHKVLTPTAGNSIFLHKLKAFRAVEVGSLRFYMKQELESKEKTKYYELCADESLRKNLAAKIVIEHPTIHVLFPEEASTYPLVSESEENIQSKKMSAGQPDADLKETNGKSVTVEIEENDEAPEELPILKSEISTIS